MLRNLIKETFCCILLFLFSFCVSAQEIDSTEVDSDTVTIYKDPYVITKTVVLPPMKHKKPARVYVSVTGGINFYTPYNNVCETCEEYHKFTKSTNKPTMGNMAGIDLMYLPSSLFINTKVQYNQYREQFNFSDSNNTRHNRHNYYYSTDISLGGGVRIGKDKSIQLLLGVEGRLGLLHSVNGVIPDSSTQKVVTDLHQVFTYRKSVPGISASIKTLFKIANKLYLSPEISYGYDFKSIVAKGGPYTIQRHILMMRFGLTKGF